MGYYIDCPTATGKAEWLIKEHGAHVMDRAIFMPPEGSTVGLVCVIENGTFDAAGVAFDEMEFRRFVDGRDGRHWTWLMMPKDKILALAHLKEWPNRD